MKFTSRLPTNFILMIIISQIIPFSLCQLLGRLLTSLHPSFDYVYDEPQESDRHDDDHHPSHPHSHPPHSHSHSIPHSHQRHQQRPPVNTDRHTSASVRNSNQELFSTEKQLALVRDLNKKIDREFRQKFLSKPFPLQLSASDPVLCKSSGMLTGSPPLASERSFPIDLESMTGRFPDRKMSKPSDLSFNFKKTPFLGPNHKMFDRKPLFDLSETELLGDSGTDYHSLGHTYDHSLNHKKNHYKGFHSHESYPIKAMSPKNYGFDEFDKYIEEMFGTTDHILGKSDDFYSNYKKAYQFEDELYDKDVLDSTERAVTQLPRTIADVKNWDDFRPSLKMTRIPNHKFVNNIHQKSSHILKAYPKKNKINSGFLDFAQDLGIDRFDNKSLKAKEKTNRMSQTNSLIKHPDKSYDKLGLKTTLYPKEHEKIAFNSAGYLDLLPQSKP